MSKELQKEYELSKGPYQWIMDEPVIEPTYPVSTNIRLQGVGNNIGCSLVDENSELLNITRKYSRCPENKYIPCSIGQKPTAFGPVVDNQLKFKKQSSQDGNCGEANTSFPDCLLETESTLLTTPVCTTKEVGFNRWDYLHFDPQANVSIPFDHNINNSIIVKDNHRPCIPTPIDQSLCLP